VNGPATWRYPNGINDQGHVQGDISAIGDVRVFYKEGARTDPFIGKVTGADGETSGTRPPDVGWQTKLVCAQKAEAKADPNSREVTGDVDVYDVPGGVGTVIGMLDGGDGQRVQLGSGCKEDHWCNVVWPAGPGGTAWVWGDFLK
jgi:hypothetical protein